MEEEVLHKLHRYKLESKFLDEGECVIHTTYITDLASRQRRVATEARWTDKRELGAGGFGCVMLQENQVGNVRAVKQLFRRKGADYRTEIKALSKVMDRDDLFVQFLGWYESRQFFYIAMEYIEFGDLGGYMASGDHKRGSNTREITRQVLEGLVVLHERDICHRDLKPQNILIASPDPIWVKIADFGSSKYLKGTQLYTQIGTQGYLAPEMLGIFTHRGPNLYTVLVDLWSLGAIVHEMLSSQIPFTIQSTMVDSEYSGLETEIEQPQLDITKLHKFCLGGITLPTEILEGAGASDSAITFVKGLLRPDPESRLSASAALGTDWMLETRGLLGEVVTTAQRFKVASRGPSIEVSSDFRSSREVRDSRFYISSTAGVENTANTESLISHWELVDSPNSRNKMPITKRSPAQVKRVLEAHLLEVNKRIENAGYLGRELLSQQQEYEARIQKLEEGGDIVDPELEQQLVELEKEYEQIGRESARAVLANNVTRGDPSPYAVGNLAGGTNSLSVQAQSTESPTRRIVPSRRQRNQGSRQHDLEFAADIGQGLIQEVRRLQSMLAERDEALKILQVENNNA